MGIDDLQFFGGKIMDQTYFIIILLNTIILMGLISGLRRWRGRLSGKKIILTLLGFFSFATITIFIPLIISKPGPGILTEIILLLLIWGIGFIFLRRVSKGV
jgi:hypothetical protein